MKNYSWMRSGLDEALPWLWAAVWLTLPVSLKINVYCVILFGIAVILKSFYKKPEISRQQVVLAVLFLALFAWHAASFLYDPEKYTVYKGLEKKFSLVGIPLIMLLASGNVKGLTRWAIRGFLAGLVLTGTYLLIIALYKFGTGQPTGSFTYHEFTRPVDLGATYYSCYLSAALIYLTYRDGERIALRFRVPLVIFFLVLLMFCASKLFIAITVPAILWAVINKYIRQEGVKKYLVPVIFILVVIAGSAPFINRMLELKDSGMKVVLQEEYRYDTPLNGLTYRLILWRFAGEILEDENAWLTGTGIGSRQVVLDGYYKRTGMYTGNPDLGDKGYLGYNFHNQYLETLVGTGLPGLCLLLSSVFLIFFIKRNKHFFPLLVYIVIMLYFLTESMLERQAGIVFFSLTWALGAYHKIDD